MVAMRESIDRVLLYANANAYVYHENKWTFKDLSCSSAAVTYLFEGFLSGRFSVEPIASPSWRYIEPVTRSVFTAGCIASYGRYNDCLSLDVPGSVKLNKKFKTELNCMIVSELLYSPIPVGRQLRHWREVMNESEMPEVELLRVHRSRAMNMLTGLEIHCLGGLLIFCDIATGKRCYLDNMCRSNLCVALLSVGQTALYALTYRLHDVHDNTMLRNTAIDLQPKIFNYMRTVLNGIRPDPDKVATFAKHIKASYTAILNKIDLKGVTVEERDIVMSQFRVLSQGANVLVGELRTKPVLIVFGPS